MAADLSVSSPVTVVPQISERYASVLGKLGIETVLDLITHFPRYQHDTTELSLVSQLQPDTKATIQGRVEKFSSVRIRGGRTLQKATIVDSEGSLIAATWFNQPYLQRALSGDGEFLFSGGVKDYKGKLSFFPSSFEPIVEGKEQVHLGRLSPQYPLTSGVTIKWLRNRIKYVLDNLNLLPEFVTELKQLDSNLAQIAGLTTDLQQDLYNIHFPSDMDAFEQSRENLQLLELINLHLNQIREFSSRKVFHAPQVKIDTKLISSFIGKLSFELTGDQEATIANVLVDLTKPIPMNRLVQGDVGSGKTIIAVVAALAMHSAGLQTVILAPTTVLAAQHFQTFTKLLEGQKLGVQLVTGNTPTDSAGDIIIGTSAVLARKANLINNLGLVVVDEQHKFGVSQREELLAPLQLKQDKYPHFLDMTATPIPRTLALALFSDMQVSSLQDKPKGRLPIHTHLVPEAKRGDSYAWIKDLVETKNQQVYWVCPLVEESEKLEISSAKAIFKHLSEQVFPGLSIGLMHGKLKPAEKEAVMQDFKDGNTQILVSTSVIEVGIDVSNATVVVIEGADRFGLAQLHQIRGRVGRGDQQSWCFLFPSAQVSDHALERLKFFSENLDGLKISEFDLSRRGPGEVYGTKQSGIPNLKIASFDNIDQIKRSRELAKQLYQAGIDRISLFDRL